jgi:signal transduction histidine kinase
MRALLLHRPILRLAAAGLGCALLVAAAGLWLERSRFGATDREAFERVQREVQAEFGRMATELSRVAGGEAEVARTSLGDQASDRGTRELFSRASALIRGMERGSAALTVYELGRGNTVPVAWAGRPSELPTERVNGPAALFIAPGPLGFRLVRIEPVTSKPAGARVGTVAAERVFSEHSTVAGAARQRFSIETSLAEVSLRTRYEGAGERDDPASFLVRAPSGDPLLEATVDPADLRASRSEFRRGVIDVMLATLGLTLLLVCGPLLDRRALSRDVGAHAWCSLAIAGLVVAARAVFWLASPPGATPVLSPAVYASPELGPLFRHPIDFLLDGLAALALVVIATAELERWRLAVRGRRVAPFRSPAGSAAFVAVQAATGVSLALAVAGYEVFLANTFHRAGIDLLYFSPHPWEPARSSMQFGLIAFHAAFAWLAVIGLRTALARWRFRPTDGLQLATVLVCWGAPAGAWLARGTGWDTPGIEAALVCAVFIAAVLAAPRGLSRMRRASQGLRLVVTFVALLMPAALSYPSLVRFEDRARRRAVETVYGPEVLNQRDNLLERLQTAQQEIDRRQSELEAFVSVSGPPPGFAPTPESAFLTWRDTALERNRVSSAIELYNAAGALVSRFALNLPEETVGQRWHEENCEWQTFGEISPFGAQERQLLHAGRNICGPEVEGGMRVPRTREILGTIVIHVILDDSTLSFISSQNPYFELLRGERFKARDEAPGRELEFVVYGWSRTPNYVSGTSAWPIDERLFDRIYQSRRPFWTRLSADDRDYEVYLENDRRGIYALGYPVIPPVGHAINLAELTTLVGLLYILVLVGTVVFRVVAARRVTSGRALLREVRESFYRKLFLAFVAASVIPVVTLALVTRAYIADRLRHDVESAAHKTTAVARRVIEEYSVPAGPGLQSVLSDDAMIGLSRIVGQDVNLFNGPELVATSERDLFASGLLPTRTPADVYSAILLDRLPTVITEEQAGTFRYMVAAAPARANGRDALLTVPLTLRQQEIEREIDDLNRRIVLAAMLFILVGASIGYPLAERISDPVNRLMRATRRIARGEVDVHIATTASDELRRLVEAFNMMATELRRQRQELERTHRLEAWAEMARQVAHEIKNPLTPIQLNAEHLRRVHADRGKPLEPVLESCIDAILSQVRLLRQIASEFSSFASSPTARRAPTDLGELLHEVMRPYESGASRVEFFVDVQPGLPLLEIDRTLVGRALTNVVDNALHAMPGGGTLRVRAAAHVVDGVELVVEDTGVGMDDEALARLFEPYFSTKAVGTGLGLAIARRNVELNGGTIRVTSERGRGTRVTINLPRAETGSSTEN